MIPEVESGDHGSTAATEFHSELRVRRTRSWFSLLCSISLLSSCTTIIAFLVWMAIKERPLDGPKIPWLGLVLGTAALILNVVGLLGAIGSLRGFASGRRGVEVRLEGSELIVVDHDSIQFFPPGSCSDERRFDCARITHFYIKKQNINGWVSVESIGTNLGDIVDFNPLKGRVDREDAAEALAFLSQRCPSAPVEVKWTA